MRVATGFADNRIQFKLDETIDQQHDRFFQPVLQHHRRARRDEQHARLRRTVDLSAAPARR